MSARTVSAACNGLSLMKVKFTGPVLLLSENARTS